MIYWNISGNSSFAGDINIPKTYSDPLLIKLADFAISIIPLGAQQAEASTNKNVVKYINAYPNTEAWRWFGVQLSNNVEMALVPEIYTKDSSVAKKNDLFIFLNNKEIIKSQDYEIKDLEYWTHPKTNVRYPVKWQLDVPNRDIHLTITTLIPNQVIDNTGGFYEGTCLVSGIFEGNTVTGRAQFEEMP